jgi:hypothetical protein
MKFLITVLFTFLLLSLAFDAFSQVAQAVNPCGTEGNGPCMPTPGEELPISNLAMLLVAGGIGLGTQFIKKLKNNNKR